MTGDVIGAERARVATVLADLRASADYWAILRRYGRDALLTEAGAHALGAVLDELARRLADDTPPALDRPPGLPPALPSITASRQVFPERLACAVCLSDGDEEGEHRKRYTVTLGDLRFALCIVHLWHLQRSLYDASGGSPCDRPHEDWARGVAEALAGRPQP